MIDLPAGPFDLIAADPPWPFTVRSDKGRGRSPEAHYETMSIDEICALPVGYAAARDSLMMLWIPGYEMVRGTHVRVLTAWGFEPSSVGFVWIKRKKVLPDTPLDVSHLVAGLGFTTRQNAEFVIFGRRGRPKRAAKNVHQIIVAPRREHSRKPDEFYRRAEIYAGRRARRLELFAREERPGWTCWGNETSKFGEPSWNRQAA